MVSCFVIVERKSDISVFTRKELKYWPFTSHCSTSKYVQVLDSYLNSLQFFFFIRVIEVTDVVVFQSYLYESFFGIGTYTEDVNSFIAKKDIHVKLLRIFNC